MQSARSKRIWAAYAAIMPAAGIPLGRFVIMPAMQHPGPGTYFALGFLTALTLGGIVYGIWSGMRSGRG